VSNLKIKILNFKIDLKCSLVLNLLVLSIITPIINEIPKQQSDPSLTPTNVSENILEKDQTIKNFINDSLLNQIDSDANNNPNYSDYLSDIEKKQKHEEFPSETGYIDEKNPSEYSNRDIFYSLPLDKEIIATWNEVCKWAGIQTLFNTSGGTEIKVSNGTIKMVVGFDQTVNISESDTESLFSSNYVLESNIEQLNTLVISVPISSLATFYDEYGSLEEVRYIDPALIYSIEAIPNDPNWPIQWGPSMIQADLAWDIQMGDPSSVLVAVIDTGIDYNHPDLCSQYVPLGYDFVNNDTDPMDDNYHGTHCAGIIAATINNTLGIAGVANISIMAEKGLDSGARGYDYWLADAIIHAVDVGADILSNSWGMTSPSTLIEDALAYAAAEDVVIVAAAGNYGNSYPFYPAAYPEAISVSATDINDNLASFSNYGSWIELAAPGVNIYSTFPGNSYNYLDGTSMACPHVAAVVALISSEFPMWTADDIRQHLRYTATDLGDFGWDQYYGYGRVNAYQAVQPVPQHDLRVLLKVPTPIHPSETININAEVFNFGLSNETDVELQLMIDDTLFDSVVIPMLINGSSNTLSIAWTPTFQRIYNITAFVVPVVNETSITNNLASKRVLVKYPFNYTMEVGVPYNWIDATNGSFLSLGNDDAEPVDLPFSFQFYDQVYSTVFVGDNGWLSFYNTYPNSRSSLAFPSFDPTYYYAIALFWDDLFPVSNVYILTLTNPNRFVIEYHDIDHFGFEGRAGSFEVILFETGKIVFQYDYIDVVGTHTVGLNYGLDPMHFNTYYGLTNSTNNLAIQFTETIPEHDVRANLKIAKFLCPGEKTIINAAVFNSGLNNETDVELQILIDDTLVTSQIYSTLLMGESKILNYSWTPSVEKIYNVTAYVVPVVNEVILTNNQIMVYVRVTPTPVILFDEAHLPLYSIGSNPAYYMAGGYSEFAGMLIATGYIVLTIDPGTVIDASVLSDADILVIIGSQNAYMAAELDAIETWVANRGSLLLISDYFSLGLNVNSLAVRLGFIFENDVIQDSDDTVGTGIACQLFYDGSNLLPHIITNGVFRVEMYCGDGLISVPSDEIPIIRTDADGTAAWGNNSPAINVSVMSILDGGSAGAGRVCVIGDSNVWDNVNDADEDGDLNFYDSDNEILARNTINWLSMGMLDHDLYTCIEAPSFIRPKDSVLINTTVYNRGLNDERDVELQLLINGTLFDSIVIPLFANGSSYTFSSLWTPTIQGIYNITAYAVPVINETWLSNNRATTIVRVKLGSIILFDEAHLPFYSIGSNPAYYIVGGYSDFAGMLMEAGYIIGTIDPGIVIDISILIEADILVIVDSQNAYTAAELDSIETWVINGGRLLLITDGGDYMGYMNALAARFGFNFANTMLHDSDDYTMYESWVIYNDTNLLPHSITTGISNIELYAGDGLITAPIDEIPIITTDTDGTTTWSYGSTAFNVSVMSILDGGSAGAGKVCVIGDCDLWCSLLDLDEDGDLNFYDSDNEILAWNTINWLSKKPDHNLHTSIEVPSLLLLSETTMINATIQNRGLNNEANVELQLLINNTIVASQIYPSLLVGTSETLSYSWTPSTEGIYNITAYVVPVTNETVTYNNRATHIIDVIPYVGKIILIYSDLDSNAVLIGETLHRCGFQYNLLNVSNYVPTLYDILDYPVAFIWTNYPIGDPVGLGDVIADYLDLGGAVIVSSGSFVADSDFDIEGRFTSYSPFVNGPISFSPRTYTSLSSHPVFNDVGWVSSYRGEQVSIAPEASLVASWSDGYPFVGIKGSVVGITASPLIEYWDLDLDLVWVNSFFYLLNRAPNLTNGTVSPLIGTTSTIFTYSVNYTDVENEAPNIIQVIIDGTPHNMIKQNISDNVYTNGCIYTYATILSEGSHSYHFEASDGIKFSRSPDVGLISGPIVSTQPADLLNVDIIEKNFSIEEFIITFSVYNESGQGIDFATIKMWWNGTDVSTSVQNLGSGIYKVILIPIFIKPDEDPILLNMTISASGYENKYFETLLAVDPGMVKKKPDGGELGIILTVFLIIISTILSTGVIMLWLRKKRNIT